MSVEKEKCPASRDGHVWARTGLPFYAVYPAHANFEDIWFFTLPPPMTKERTGITYAWNWQGGRNRLLKG